MPTEYAEAFLTYAYARLQFFWRTIILRPTVRLSIFGRISRFLISRRIIRPLMRALPADNSGCKRSSLYIIGSLSHSAALVTSG